MISDPAVLAAAGSIAGVEGEHVVSVTGSTASCRRPTPPSRPALTMDEVLAAVAPFMGMGSMPATGGVEENQGSARAV
jgi:hypothetical protein